MAPGFCLRVWMYGGTPPNEMGKKGSKTDPEGAHET